MTVINRRDWGARAPRGAYTTLTRTRGVKIHYTGDHVDPAIVDDHARCVAVVKSIQNHHMDNNGWIDIGYSMVVCPHRTVFQGRGAGHLPAANGAGLNSDHYAVLGLVGSSGLTRPPNNLLLGILDAIGYLREHGGAGSEIKGHRDGYGTDCPGDALYAWVKAGAPRPGASGASSTNWTETTVNQLPLLTPGDTGLHAKSCFYLLQARGYGRALNQATIDPNVYGPAVVAELRRFQADKGLDNDGMVGKATWPKLLGL
ncbi:peptidoglycan recognition protein family protein [Streptosporangium carneum]|uniref:N-acetylmuramoyl-L-alanine amidase n=1 Tax=Streptosporangium carneum TaxID=47481 RepID=A0A9W6IAH6_9ACTN|nr:peptidoglycan-binding protein [Streptosporangium carneum]GLK14153.1 N-acetylmuramoyl-L-alanine amidase [Streptosporangium carneum]